MNAGQLFYHLKTFPVRYSTIPFFHFSQMQRECEQNGCLECRIGKDFPCWVHSAPPLFSLIQWFRRLCRLCGGSEIVNLETLGTSKTNTLANPPQFVKK